MIRNNIHYEPLRYSYVESAYGVSLRELALFSEATYTQDDGMTPMEKAISVILFKLEGQVIMRHPNWRMEDRLLLEHVDPAQGRARPQRHRIRDAHARTSPRLTRRTPTSFRWTRDA